MDLIQLEIKKVINLLVEDEGILIYDWDTLKYKLRQDFPIPDEYWDLNEKVRKLSSGELTKEEKKLYYSDLKRFYEFVVILKMKELDELKKYILEDIKSIIPWVSIKDANLKWCNENWNLDDPSRAIEKIIKYGDVNSLLDISRWTLHTSNLLEIEEIYHRLLESEFVDMVYVKDNFSRPTGYRDMNLSVKTGKGTFELQIHLSSLLEAKTKWMKIPHEFVESKIRNKETNYYWNTLEKLYDGEQVFNERDFQITKRINKELNSNIRLPKNWEKINWDEFYRLRRKITDIVDITKNPNRTIPDWLKDFDILELKSYVKSCVQKLLNLNLCNVLEKLYNGEQVFNERDFQITERINKELNSNIRLPKNWEKINWDEFYRLRREITDIVDITKNPNRTIPDWLKDFDILELKSYAQKLLNYENLLFDYAFSLDKN